MKKTIVGVVGNPNCGKTTLFNALTGSKQRVGNWPGVTVERKVGQYVFNDVNFELVDLPGTYALDTNEGNVSIDEQIARDFVTAGKADLIINIVDASNLERNLYLTSQLIEMEAPMLLTLNMTDVAAERGIEIDGAKLESMLDCPAVSVVASTGKGIDELKKAIFETSRTKKVSQTHIEYAPALEHAILRLIENIGHKVGGRWQVLSLLEGDKAAITSASDETRDMLSSLQGEVKEVTGEDIDIVIADARYGFANNITGSVVVHNHEVKRSLSDKIDRVALNRILGIPIFLTVMYLMFMFTINIGGAFIDFFDQIFGTILVDSSTGLLEYAGAPQWLILLLANGIGSGIQVVATFIPVIAFLYLFLSALEDSGYMARAAFVMDRAMRSIGLPGKAFVPLIVGFGCNVPAIMAARTMEYRRDRIMTIVMAPFMSCGARLPVYALFAAAFFPLGGQNVVFLLYIIGILVAAITGLIMKNTLLQGHGSPFIMELPPYHIPTLKGVLLRTWERTKSFIFRAGKVIVPMVLALNALNSLGTDGSYGNEDSDKSVLSAIGKTIAPAFSLMGMNEENWPAAVGIFTGVLAKEAVVGTLDSLYGELAKTDAAAAGASLEEEKLNFQERIIAAFATIPANLRDALGAWSDPLGVDVGKIATIDAAAEAQEVSTGTFGAMAARFDGVAGAFAYLLFVLLYFPCTAALAAVYRETNMRWALFVAGWTTGIAYIASTIYYQAAIFARHPVFSASMIATMSAIFISVMIVLRLWGWRQEPDKTLQTEGVSA